MTAVQLQNLAASSSCPPLCILQTNMGRKMCALADEMVRYKNVWGGQPDAHLSPERMLSAHMMSDCVMGVPLTQPFANVAMLLNKVGCPAPGAPFLHMLACPAHESMHSPHMCRGRLLQALHQADSKLLHAPPPPPSPAASLPCPPRGSSLPP